METFENGDSSYSYGGGKTEVFEYDDAMPTILDKKSWNTWCQRSLINRLSPLPHYNVGLNSNGKQTTLHGVGGGGDVNL